MENLVSVLNQLPLLIGRDPIVLQQIVDVREVRVSMVCAEVAATPFEIIQFIIAARYCLVVAKLAPAVGRYPYMLYTDLRCDPVQLRLLMRLDLSLLSKLSQLSPLDSLVDASPNGSA